MKGACFYKYSSCFILLLIFSQVSVYGQIQIKPMPVSAEVVDIGSSKVLKGASILNNEGYFVWGGSVVKGEDGRYHMFYSRWKSGPDTDVFSKSWVLESEIAYAVSDKPARDFRYVKTILQGKRFEGDTVAWDSQAVHNPHIKKFKNTYYLYYIAGHDPGEQSVESTRGYLDKRSRVQQSQQIGVIKFNTIDDLLSGNFKRPNTPLISPKTRVKQNKILNPSPEGTKPMPSNIITVNPSVVENPIDGKFILYFKGNLYDPSWRGVHGYAISDNPDGPFEQSDKIVFKYTDAEGKIASAEDPYVWYSPSEEIFYAVFKDFTGAITKSRPGLAILKSKDGIEWENDQNKLFSPLEVTLQTGEVVKVSRLERPQLLIDEKGIPIAMYAACALENLNKKNDGSSFNIQIPIEVNQP
ncbi:glycoside hydrolase family protein [Joostella sp.]|uniref:glycoside hydrolase family protein n=1 Tax=Joostella sp. TaxID=2231138 RepID=UPI003A8F6F6B